MSFEDFSNLWSAANASSDLAAIENCWAPDGAFVPSDGVVVLHGSAAIAQWMLRRRGERPPRLQLVELCSWRFPETVVVAALQTAAMEGEEGLVSGRAVTLLAALAFQGGLKLRHVAEAAPAVLPQVIAAYKAQARTLFS